MARGTVPNPRQYLKAVAAVGLILGVAVAVRAQTRDESFEEKLRKAAEAQTKKNQADGDEQKQLVAALAAKREARQKQEGAEKHQRELAFRKKTAMLKQEQVARQRELETTLKDNRKLLAKALADLGGQMGVTEAESERDFKLEGKEFSQRLQAKVTEEHAKAEAKRERKKQIALMAAMTCLTGGASLPALAAAGAESTAATSPKAAPTMPCQSLPLALGKSSEAKRDVEMLASRPSGNQAKTGLPEKAVQLPRPIVPSLEDDAIYPTWDILPWERVASVTLKLASKIPGLSKTVRGPYHLPGTAPVGRRTAMHSLVDPAAHNPQMKIPAGKPMNLSEVIGGREYTGHALDRMAGRGLLPSIVENTIKVGQKTPGQKAGTLLFFDPRNKVRVILDTASGRVLTVE